MIPITLAWVWKVTEKEHRHEKKGISEIYICAAQNNK